MSSKPPSPPSPPTLASLSSVLPEYGKLRFDRTLAATRDDIGSQPDLGVPDQARRLRCWLNQWLCRIGYPRPGETDVFADSLAILWGDFEDTLPAGITRLAQLEHSQLQAISRAYGDLYKRAAVVSKTSRTRRVGATAAAKLLYFARPAAVTAWDRTISIRTGGGQDEAAFLTHLTTCRGWAKSLEA